MTRIIFDVAHLYCCTAPVAPNPRFAAGGGVAVLAAVAVGEDSEEEEEEGEPTPKKKKASNVTSVKKQTVDDVSTPFSLCLEAI
jgi:hypothetical protein